MITQCPKCGGRTALLNNTCEHCGCKVKTCSECGNIVEESSEICTYCGLSFAKMAEIKAVEAKEADLEKNKKDVAELAKYAKSANKVFQVLNTILSIITLLPICFACFSIGNPTALYGAISLAIKVTLIMAIFTYPLQALFAWLGSNALAGKIRRKAKELNFDSKAYLKSLQFNKKGEVMLDSSVAPVGDQLNIIEAYRVEKDSSNMRKRVAATIIDVMLMPVAMVFLCIWLMPVADQLLYLSAEGVGSIVPYLSVVFTPNIFAGLFWCFGAIGVVLRVIFFDPKKKKNSQFVRQYQVEN